MGRWGTRRRYPISRGSSPMRRNRSRNSTRCSGIRSRRRQSPARIRASMNACSTHAAATVHPPCRPPSSWGSGESSTRSTRPSRSSRSPASTQASGCRSCASMSPTSRRGSPRATTSCSACSASRPSPTSRPTPGDSSSGRAQAAGSRSRCGRAVRWNRCRSCSWRRCPRAGHPIRASRRRRRRSGSSTRTPRAALRAGWASSDSSRFGPRRCDVTSTSRRSSRGSS